MEKRILPIIFLAFVFEVCFFLYDLNLLPYFPNQSEIKNANRTEIGEVLWTKANVQRKHKDSIVWTESEKSQTLFGYDSVLTLKNSSAKLNLEGNIQLDLSENTLVVLEPPKQENTSRFRIRFQKGHLRTRTKEQNLAFESGEWTVEANKNTDLAFRSLPSGTLSVEVKEGSAKIESGEKVLEIKEGSLLEIDETNVISEKVLSAELKWESEFLNKNHYSFEFPVELNLSWSGPAKKLTAYNTRGDTLSYPIETTQQSKELDLDAGTWVFRLESGELSSESLSINLYPAKRVSHLYPLPRSRLDMNLSTRFSWVAIPEAESYKIIFEPTDGVSERKVRLTKLPYWSQEFTKPGSYNWSIKALDESGFEIPSYYQYPMEVIEDPLAPPELRSPSLRGPASPAPKPDAMLEQIFNILIPKVYAEESYQRNLIFSWFPVPGADYYTVEVSEDPNFINPIVTEKVDKEEYTWVTGSQKTVYYRVAAGKNNGRKGLFSAPQKVDLEKLKSINISKDLQPGVRLQVRKLNPKVAPDEKLPAQKKEEPKEEKVAEKPKPERDKEFAIPPPDPLASDLTFRIGGYWSSGLTVNSQTTEDSVNVSQQGFLLSRVGFELAFPLFSIGHVALLSDIIEAPWTSVDSQAFQDDISQRDQTHSLRFGKTGSSKDYGIFYKVYDIAQRTDDEEITFREINPVGAAYFFRYGLFERWDSKHMIGLGYGDKFYHVQSDNYVYTDLEMWDDNIADLGFEFNVRYGNGESGTSYLGTNFLFRLGLMF